MNLLLPYIKLCRPHQYVKNLLIIFPLFFAAKITETDLLLQGFLAIGAFSMVSSSVYIFNDYWDLEYDKKHPEKQNRPLPSGQASVKASLLLMMGLVVGGLGFAYYLHPHLFFILLFYSLLNASYSLKIKHIPILDVTSVAIGFVLRLFAGAVVTGVPLSQWIILITFLLSLFIALAKRRDDLIVFLNEGEKTRKVIDGYNLQMLDFSMAIMASVSIVSYVMYCVSPEVTNRLETEKLYFTVFFVILGIMRYLQLTLVEEKSGSPTKILFKDKFIQLSTLGWIISFVLLLYFKEGRFL